MGAAADEMERKLVFAVNGERFELAKVDPSITLLEFLRTRTRFTGPKLGCGEGEPLALASRFYNWLWTSRSFFLISDILFGLSDVWTANFIFVREFR